MLGFEDWSTVNPGVFESVMLFLEKGNLDADRYSGLEMNEAAPLLAVHGAISDRVISRPQLELDVVKPEVFESLLLSIDTDYLEAEPQSGLDVNEMAMLLGVLGFINKMEPSCSQLQLEDTKPEVFESLLLFIETGYLDADQTIECI